MTLKTDTEIIWLPLPEIFSGMFTYLLAMAVSATEFHLLLLPHPVVSVEPHQLLYFCVSNAYGEDGYSDNSVDWQ